MNKIYWCLYWRNAGEIEYGTIFSGTETDCNDWHDRLSESTKQMTTLVTGETPANVCRKLREAGASAIWIPPTP